MINPSLKKKGFFQGDIIVWNGIISKIEVIQNFIDENDYLKFASKREIKKYFKFQQ